MEVILKNEIKKRAEEMNMTPNPNGKHALMPLRVLHMEECDYYINISNSSAALYLSQILYVVLRTICYRVTDTHKVLMGATPYNALCRTRTRQVSGNTQK